MGMVVGHELTHGFDDEGRQFDARRQPQATGGRRTSGKDFVRRARRAWSDQFDGYIVDRRPAREGRAHAGRERRRPRRAQARLRRRCRPARRRTERARHAARFTPEQQFFLGYAQAWCTNTRPEEARRRVTTDPHSPAAYRVNGPLSNLPQFQQAFGCKAGDRMVAQNRCEVW